MTPEQERIYRLFVKGDNSANLATADATNYNPASKGMGGDPTNPADQVKSSGSDYLSLSTKPNDSYSTAIRNRLTAIDQIGTDAMAQKQQAAQRQASVQPTGGGDYAGPVGYTGTMTTNERRNAVLKAASGAAGTPYSWGGGNAKGPSYGIGSGSGTYGFDCSGLVQYAYAQIGIKLPRVAADQMAMGTKVPLDKLQPGDLLASAQHIAIYAGNGMMWESPSPGQKVRLAPIRMNELTGVHINY